MDPGEERPPEYLWVKAWLERWEGQVRVADYSSGGWKHCWDVDGPEEAIREVPDDYQCRSEWANP
jgi:hypothetical protein